jgi:hypothetical protein
LGRSASGSGDGGQHLRPGGPVASTGTGGWTRASAFRASGLRADALQRLLDRRAHLADLLADAAGRAHRPAQSLEVLRHRTHGNAS